MVVVAVQILKRAFVLAFPFQVQARIIDRIRVVGHPVPRINGTLIVVSMLEIWKTVVSFHVREETGSDV